MVSEVGPRSNSSASPNNGHAHDCPLSMSPRLARKASRAESVRSASVVPSIAPSLLLDPAACGGCVQFTGTCAEDDEAPGVSQGMWCCEPPADVVLCSGDKDTFDTSSFAAQRQRTTPVQPAEGHPRSFFVRPFGWGLGTSSPFALRYSLGKTHGIPRRVLESPSAMSTQDGQRRAEARRVPCHARTMIHRRV